MYTTYYENKRIQESQFEADVCMDFYNERLRVDDFRGNVSALQTWIMDHVTQYLFQKVIIKTRNDHLTAWLKLGYQFEGEFRSYFNGGSAIAVCKYFVAERRNSSKWVEEDTLLHEVQKLPNSQNPIPLSSNYSYRLADESDSTELAQLYGKVFEVYPTPMDDPLYIKKMLESGTIFAVILNENKIVSAASADVNAIYHNAELTDCATLPEHRKYGLMKILIDHLEKELFQRKIFCAYSIARARSFGMNAVFHQRGYEYTGRLANNCKIFQEYEDMNIWVKDLSE